MIPSLHPFLPFLFRVQEAAPEAVPPAPAAAEPPGLIATLTSSVRAIESITQELFRFLVSYGFQILGAIVILVIGVWISGRLARGVTTLCVRRKIDITLAKFFGTVTRVVALGFVALIVVNQFGVNIAPFIAAIGAGAFGLSLAVQGPISNYGAGLSLILTRPFRVGDTITIQDCSGVVEEIGFAATRLRTEDSEVIVIPNRKVVGETFENTFRAKLVDGRIGIAYGEDPERAIALLRATLAALPGVVSEPPFQVGIHAFADSAIEIGYRVWVPTQAYHQNRFSLNLAVFNALRHAGIQIPFPQREVRLLPSKESNG